MIIKNPNNKVSSCKVQLRRILITLAAVLTVLFLPSLWEGQGMGLFAQNIGINTTGTTPDPSAMLDVSSTVQGILIPRLTDAQRQLLKDPATGLMIYNTTTNEINFYNGTGWQTIQKNTVSTTSAAGAGPGGGIGINTSGNAPHPSALLDVSATDKGLLIPKTTTASVTAVTGLIIYNTTTNNINYYNGTSWISTCAGLIDNNKGTGAVGAGVGINATGAAPDLSAILDVSSSTKGLLIPQMTSAQRDAIQTPAQGLMVYNNTNNRIENWIGSAWFEWVVTNCCSNAWNQKANFGGTARNTAVGFSIGNKGYIGTGNDGVAKQDFWEWDQTSNVWTQKANFGGTARYSAVGFSIGTKGYIGTGTDGAYKQDFYEWDQATNVWTQKANFPGTPRVNAVGFSIGTKGYIGTGQTPSLTKDFWEWDQATDTWAPKLDFGGAARTGAVGFSIGTKGYIGTGEVPAASKDFWEWDQATDTWAPKLDFGGTARSLAIGFSIGTRGYIGTGYSPEFADFWEWDQATNVWIQKTNFGGTARHADVGFSIGTKGYIGIGNDGVNKQDFWEYCPTGCPVPAPPVAGPTDGCPGSTSFIANWTAVGATTSYLDVATDVGFTAFVTGYNNLNVGSATTQNVTGLTAGTYYYRVRGSNSCGTSANSATITVTVAACSNSWCQKADFGGTGRYYAVSFTIGTKGYIGTGQNGTTKYADLWEYDATTNAWTQKADYGGGGRYGSVGFSIGTKGYIGTGSDQPGAATQDFWEWNQSTNIWTQKANYAGGITHGASGFSIGNKGYIGTGNSPGVSSEFWEYNPATDVWTAKASFGGGVRIYAFGFSIGSKGYMGTGSLDGGDVNRSSDWWEYDPITDVWTSKTAYGGGTVYGVTGFSIGAIGYVGTGYVAPGITTKQFYEYNPAGAGTWTQKTDLAGIARTWATGFSINSNGYLGTGAELQVTMVKNFWKYCPAGCILPADPVATTATGITATSFTANWTASLIATTYYLDVATDAAFTAFVSGYNNLNVGNVTSYSVTGVNTLTTTYYYHIRANNSCGNSINSATITTCPSFSDDFSGTDAWLDNDPANIGVNTTTDKLDFNILWDGTNDACVYDLGAGSVSDTNWVVRCNINFSTLGTPVGPGNEMAIVISDMAQTVAAQTAQDFIGMYIRHDNSGAYGYGSMDADAGVIPGISGADATLLVGLTTATDYYCEIIRTSATTYIVEMFTNSDFSTGSLGQVAGTCAPTTASLRYIKITNYNLNQPGVPAMIGTIDNIQFCTGVTSF